MSTFPCGASLHRKLLLASPVNREERAWQVVVVFTVFLQLPQSQQGPAVLPARSPIRYYPALRQRSHAEEPGEACTMFLLQQPGAVFIWERLTEGTSSEQERSSLGQGQHRSPCTVGSLQLEFQRCTAKSRLSSQKSSS